MKGEESISQYWRNKIDYPNGERKTKDLNALLGYHR